MRYSTLLFFFSLFSLGAVAQTKTFRDKAYIDSLSNTKATATTATTAVTALPLPTNAYDSTLYFSDSTLMRFQPALATPVSLTSVAEVIAFLTTAQTNKDATVVNGVYEKPTGIWEQNVAWNNVRFRAQTRGGVTLRVTAAANTGGVFIMTGSSPRTRICIDGFKADTRSTVSGGNPIVSVNELVPYDGLEWGFWEITSNRLGNYNGFNAQSYSPPPSGSSSGATSKNLYIHNMYIHDVGRANEILSQEYAQAPRLSGVVITNNRVERMGINDSQFGFGFSISGNIRYIYHANNVTNDTKGIANEFVNTHYVISRNNVMKTTSTTLTNGYSISDDARGLTRSIWVEAPTIDVTGRPVQAYDSRNVNFNGGTYNGHRGIDINNIVGGSVRNITALIHSTVTEAGVQFGSGAKNWIMDGCTISSSGAVAAGYLPSFESVVLRSGSTGNQLNYVTTIIGKKADGTTHTNGAIVNQGTGAGVLANTITFNTFSIGL